MEQTSEMYKIKLTEAETHSQRAVKQVRMRPILTNTNKQASNEKNRISYFLRVLCYFHFFGNC